jgi:hypothetical protein
MKPSMALIFGLKTALRKPELTLLCWQDLTFIRSCR